MRTEAAKFFRAMCLAMVLMSCAGCFLGCAPYAPGQTEVRQPSAGKSVEKFWNAFEWKSLSSQEQKLWGVLGWNEASWQGTTAKPASEGKFWSGLDENERNAAQALGYTPEYWDYLLNTDKAKAAQ